MTTDLPLSDLSVCQARTGGAADREERSTALFRGQVAGFENTAGLNAEITLLRQHSLARD